MFIWGQIRNTIRFLDHSVVIRNEDRPCEEKEAVVFLIGLRNPTDGFAMMKRYFSAVEGYDVFIPDYIARGSVDGCRELVETFLRRNELKRYKRVHFLASILGGYCLNALLAADLWPNLASVVCLRSPLQERVPAIVSKERPLFVRFFFGAVVNDLASKVYPAVPSGDFKTGLLVESKPTPYVTAHEKAVLAAGEIDWSLDQFPGTWTDAAYIPAHHDEIYVDPGILWAPFVSFIQNGAFPADTPRALVVSDLTRPFVAEKGATNDRNQ